MPDRAVVDVCDTCKGTGRVSHAPDGFAYVYPKPCPDCTPRALVAISEDRQWLVVHRPKEGRFLVYEEFHFDSGQACYGEHGGTDDTGQSAEDVLAAWLEEGQG